MTVEAMQEPLIFTHSRTGRSATGQYPQAAAADVPEKFRRKQRAALPEVSELQAVRHFTRLSQLNFSIDTHFYPLGSCTMKYNPRACNQFAMLPELDRKSTRLNSSHCSRSRMPSSA